jgi:aspartyl-tRNA(Asn)/glutamyl-tRNA(Gln) amidotransferase subunit A
MKSDPTLYTLAQDLAEGSVTSRALVEACLARIADPAGEGARAFIAVNADEARAAADEIDRQRRAGSAPSPYAGIPVSIKDLFDVAGEVTRAGSRALADAAPAKADAVAVARLRAAGFVVIGRTNMTEFAYSGLGINPHYGTPKNPWERGEGRIPGGSSSGAAISVADGMAHAGLGTDTGGSCRIPAAFTGLVGFKPTARRVPLDGALPLSPTLDSIGPIARSVACCAAVDEILSGERATPAPVSLAGLKIAVPTTLVLDDLDAAVAEGFERALAALAAAGAKVERLTVPEFEESRAMNANGGFTAAESYAWHRDLITKKRAGYDPRVLVRILKGESLTAADHAALVAGRARLVAAAGARFAPYDAIVMPTAAIVPPKIADLASDDAYARANVLALRNCTFINMIDGCAISLPVHAPGEAPVGLMLAGLGNADARLFAIAAAAEPVVARR